MRFHARMDDTDPRNGSRARPFGPGERIQDEHALRAHASSLVQQGIVQRLWILLVDDHGAMLPQLQQIDGTPVSPDAYAVMALRRILDVVAAPDVEVAFVLERPGGGRPTPDDWAWHDAVVRAARAQAVPLRGVLLAHGAGVDLLEPPRTLAA